MTRNDVMHDVLNSTGAIYEVVKKYHSKKLFHDQDWAFLCVCLRSIEKACKVYCDEIKPGTENE